MLPSEKPHNSKPASLPITSVNHSHLDSAPKVTSDLDSPLMTATSTSSSYSTSAQHLTPSTTPSLSPASYHRHCPLLNLSDRYQLISINNCKSSTAPLSHCDPQDPRPPPLHPIHAPYWPHNLLSWISVPLLCWWHLALYLQQHHSNISATHSTLTSCIMELKSWLQTNFLYDQTLSLDQQLSTSQ